MPVNSKRLKDPSLCGKVVLYNIIDHKKACLMGYLSIYKNSTRVCMRPFKCTCHLNPQFIKNHAIKGLIALIIMPHCYYGMA